MDCLFYTLLLLQIIKFTLGAGVIQVHLLSYVNQEWRDFDGSCCEDQINSTSKSHRQCTTQCAPYFWICLKQWQSPVDPEEPCYFGSRMTQVHKDGMVSSTGAMKFDLSGASGYSNPFMFPFSFNWPGSMSIMIEVWHDSLKVPHHSTEAGSDVQPKNDPSAEKQLLLRVAESRRLKVGKEWTKESHANKYSRLEFEYRVLCEEHYFGEDCTRYCRPRDDEYGHHICTANGTKQCMRGWTGRMCNRAICAEGCHQHNGYCTLPGECKCYLGYQGPLCDQCVRYPGCIHGTCKVAFECQCDEGWGGLFCNQDLNFCTHHKPCLNGATCVNTGSGHYTCQCRTGFSGVNCETRLETCSHNPCLNGGTCMESGWNYTCHCPAGYSGRHCQTAARTCKDEPCENGGSCVDTSGGYRCVCPDGLTGTNCNVEQDVCVQGSVCLNGGTCLAGVSSSTNPHSSSVSYQCACPIGFTGPRCETNINDCSMRPCLNEGQCQDLVGAFRCLCAPGFMGILCQRNIDDCLKRPCANGATCFDLVNDFRCVCQPGFRGKDCLIRVSQCQSNPCKNGGICTDRVDSFHCRCPLCFTGAACQLRNNDCAANADSWPGLVTFLQSNATGSLFNFGRSKADSTAPESGLAIGILILVLFALIMITMIFIVVFLYRKVKRRGSTTNLHLDAPSINDLEEYARQNEWNERRAYQMYRKEFDPACVVNIDNRFEDEIKATAVGSEYFAQEHSADFDHHDRMETESGLGFYQIDPMEKLSFGNSEDEEKTDNSVDTNAIR